MSKCKISYRIYHKGYKVEQFSEGVHWPFIWDIGTRIQRYGLWFEVTQIRHIYYANQVKIYVKLEKGQGK